MDYKKIHDQIITRSKSEQRKKTKGGIYYEQHHIIPRCMGGDNSKENLVLLTAREHFLVHYLLTFIYLDNNSIYYAFWTMVNANKNKYKVSSRLYEEARINFSNKRKGYISTLRGKKCSEELKNKLSKIRFKNNPFKGKKHSEETKEKMRLAAKDKIRNNEIEIVRVNKIKNFHKGRKRSKETCAKIKQSISNRKIKITLSFEIAEKLRNEYKEGTLSQYKLSEKYSIPRSTISAIINYKIWKGYDKRFKKQALDY